MLRALFIFVLVSACHLKSDLIGEIGFFPVAPETTGNIVPETGSNAMIQADGQSLAERIQPPPGFVRTIYPAASFGHFLQNIPLKPDGSKVLLFDGREKHRQDVHAAVLDIDIGKRDLQQCADAVMRLRAEYLWQAGRSHDLQFTFTNGFSAPYSRWRSGERIRVTGNDVRWVQTSRISGGYSSFRSYLNMVFAYAGTISLARDLKERTIDEIEAGHVFIRAGSPGHAVIVMDKAVHPETGETLVLLAQSYMPAQNIHILKNFNDPALSPWYAVQEFEKAVNTPEWRFTKDDLKGF